MLYLEDNVLETRGYTQEYFCYFCTPNIFVNSVQQNSLVCVGNNAYTLYLRTNMYTTNGFKTKLTKCKYSFNLTIYYIHFEISRVSRNLTINSSTIAA
jgi:hypothetical protein